MNRTNNIRIFYITTAISAFLCFYMGYQFVHEFQRQREVQESPLAEPVSEQQIAQEETETALPIASIEIPYEYVIVEEEGYLLVYMQDLETIYMYTDIRLAELSEELQEEIRRGKTFSDLWELYAFLENYSS